MTVSESETTTQSGTISRKRTFTVSADQSAENYITDLLSQKRQKLNDEEAEYESDPEEYSPEGSAGTPRAGFIKRIELRNFMCHDNFELELGPYMNFIIGRNGAGKSAILTGISVGLGAKATDTSRGSSTRNLIKDGKESARVTVVLSNEGYGAYDPKKYGKSIVIERKWNRTGTGSYTIKNHNGEIMDQKKRTLDDILRKFAIQVNNPLSFLSQDGARDFLAESTEHSRYQYFSEGTNISNIIQNYQDVSRHILSLQKSSEKTKAAMEQALAKFKACHSAYEKYRHSHKLREQMEKVTGKIYWYNCGVLERKRDTKEEAIENTRNEVDQNDMEIASLTAQVEVEAETQRKLASRLEKKEAELDALLETETEVRRVTEELDSRINNFYLELENYKSDIELQIKTIEEHKKDIETEREKIDRGNGGTKVDLEQRLRVSNQFLLKLKQDKEDLEKRAEAVQMASSDMQRVDAELLDVRESQQNVRNRILEILKNKDQYSAFGFNVKYLLQDIEAESRWSTKPLGPIGRYVTVKEDYLKFTDLLNAVFAKHLDSFIVCSEQDRRILEGKMRSKKLFNNIIVRKFERFSPKSYEDTTVLAALDFTNEDVRLTMVDSASVDEMGLCATESDAQRLTLHSSLKQALCLDARLSGKRVVRRNEMMNLDPVYYNQRAPIKFAGAESDKGLNEELASLSKEEHKLRQHRAQLMEKAKREKREIEKAIAENKAAMRKCMKDISELELKLSDDGDSSKVESLQEQIKICEGLIESKRGMSSEILQQLGAAKQERKAHQQRVDAAITTTTAIRRSVAELKQEHAASVQRSEDLGPQIARLNAHKAGMLEKITALQEERDSISERLESLLKEASSHCERAEVELSDSDSKDSILAEFESLQKAVEEAERNLKKSFEVIQNELIDSSNEKELCQKTHQDNETLRIRLENDLNSRFEHLHITIQEKLTRAKVAFEYILSTRGFKGRLDFDFQNKKVVTEVLTKDDKVLRSVQTLSGGERSFSQLTFLVSIWKVMKPRVCGLDEFDVYMDGANRLTATRILLRGLENSSAQSIFITPNDETITNEVRKSTTVQIHQIAAPRTS